LSDVSLSTAAYHMRVLAEYDMVAEVGRRSIRGALERFYASTVAEDPSVISVLMRTEELDAVKRPGGSE